MADDSTQHTNSIRNNLFSYAEWINARSLLSQRTMPCKHHRISVPHSYKGALLLVLVVSLLLPTANAESLTNLGAKVVRVVPGGALDSGVTWRDVSMLWGVADTKATVGKVFKYAIPSDAFNGDVINYQVNEAGSSDIPSWMYFNDASNTIEGIPTHEDVHQYYISVTAYGHSHNNTYTSKAVDVFSIDVVNGPSIESSSAATPLNEYSKNGKVKCTDGEPEALATIILDANWSKMTPKHRVHSVERMAEYSGFDKNLFKLLPAGKDGLFNSNALVAGPGNIKHQNYPGILLSWPVGCGYDVNKLPVVMVIESTAKDGGLAKNIGHDVIGWHISHPQQKISKRMKRQIAAMATIVPTLLPTQISPTSTTDVRGMESTAIPSGRVVPSETSPVMSEVIRTKISPTKSIMPTVKPTDTKVRTPSASPTKKMTSKTKTPGLMTAMPTPTPAPPLPTKAVTEGPSRTYSAPSVTETEGLSTVPVMSVKPSPSMSKTAVPSRVYVTPTDESTQVIITPTPTPPHVTKKPVVPIKPLYPSKEPPRTALPGPTQKPNQKPQLMNHIDRVYAYEGEMLVYRVPEDTFYDEEDGSTRNLKLMLLSIDGGILHKMSWIQFDSSSQTIYGLPMAEQAGKHEYVMTAIDSFGDIARDAFEVVVVASVNKPNHEFSITLSNDYEEFENDVHKKLDLIDRIAKLYGDDSADTISISYFKKGSTIFGWSNNTLPQEPCPETKIGELTKLIRDTSNGIEGEPSQALKDALAPEYEVVNIGFKPLGSCTDGYSEGTTADPSGPDAAESAKSTSEDDIWLITIVPAVIFAVVVLIGGLIAFCLYRRCRKGKLSDEDKHTFISKGIPIIFANELDENDKPPSSKTPLIMKDEKPPLPPEYPGKSSPTTQPLLSHAPSSKGDDIDEEEDPPYEPPPPFSSSPDSRQSTPRYTPAYRSPPPYVPP